MNRVEIAFADRQPALVYAVEELLRPLGLAVRHVPAGLLTRRGIWVGAEAHAEALHLPVSDLQTLFGWLSGARESATPERDRWGRARHSASPHDLAPPVDVLRAALAERLRERGVSVREQTWDGKRWAVAITHDLDAMHTPRLRAFLGDASRGDLRRGLTRGLGMDWRRESAQVLIRLAERHGIRSTLFVKAGESGREDVAASPERHREWLRDLRERGFEIGLHPSIQAATDGARLKRERDRLAAVLGHTPTLVRSHYLRWEEPITPQIYARAGFAADATLGWAEAPGFRRGTAHPFRLWDAASASPSSLWELPLAAMDTTLFEHQHLSHGDAEASLLAVCKAARQSGGLAVLLWHNSMSEGARWTRRLDALDRVIGHARDTGAALLTLGQALEASRGGSV